MIEIVQGSVEPPLEMTLTDNGNPLNLSTAVAVQLEGRRHDVVVFDEALAGPYSAVGTVARDWVAGETDIPGRVWVKATVVWPGGREQVFQPVEPVWILPAY